MFKVNDVVMHSAHGLCKIATITEDILNDVKGPVYVIRPTVPVSGQFRILIAEKNIKSSGVRYPIKKNKLPELFKVLESSPKDILEDCNKEYPKTKEKVYKGDSYKIAESIRDLENQLNHEPFRVKRDLLEHAIKILILEVSYVKGVSKIEANNIIETALRENKKKQNNH